MKTPILIRKSVPKKTYRRLMVADPGVNGGLVWNDKYGKTHARPMPDTVAQLAACIRHVHPQFFLVEKVRTSPQMGVVSAGTFMRGVGHIEGILSALEIPWAEVTPQKWMKLFDLGKVKDFPTPREWKKHLLRRASQMEPHLFRNLNLTNGLRISDAVLLWFYAKTLHQGLKAY